MRNVHCISIIFFQQMHKMFCFLLNAMYSIVAMVIDMDSTTPETFMFESLSLRFWAIGAVGFSYCWCNWWCSFNGGTQWCLILQKVMTLVGDLGGQGHFGSPRNLESLLCMGELCQQTIIWVTNIDKQPILSLMLEITLFYLAGGILLWRRI